MKRRLTLRASDGLNTIRIEALLDTPGLSREEMTDQRRDLASRLMRSLEGVRYTGIVLADVRVQS